MKLKGCYHIIALDLMDGEESCVRSGNRLFVSAPLFTLLESEKGDDFDHIVLSMSYSEILPGRQPDAIDAEGQIWTKEQDPLSENNYFELTFNADYDCSKAFSS